MVYLIKFTVSSNEYIGYPSKEKFELLYGLCWENIDLLGENRMCGMIICHSFKKTVKKNEEMMRLMIGSEPLPFFRIKTWTNKKMKKYHEINDGQWALVFSLSLRLTMKWMTWLLPMIDNNGTFWIID